MNFGCQLAHWKLGFFRIGQNITVYYTQNTQNGAQGTLNISKKTRNSEVFGETPLIDLLRRRFLMENRWHRSDLPRMTGEVFVWMSTRWAPTSYKWSYNSIGEITPVSMASYPWYFRPFIGTPITGPFMKKTPATAPPKRRRFPKPSQPGSGPQIPPRDPKEPEWFRWGLPGFP